MFPPCDCGLVGNSDQLVRGTLLTNLKSSSSLGSNASAAFIAIQSLVIPGASAHPPVVSIVDAPGRLRN